VATTARYTAVGDYEIRAAMMAASSDNVFGHNQSMQIL
jgi:hypothetical protein